MERSFLADSGLAWKLLRRRLKVSRRMAILGIPTQEIPIDISHVVFNQLTLRGIYGREMFETWYKMSVLLRSGLDIRPVITHRFSFREHEAAFAAARSGDSGKVLMDWRD